MNVEFVHQKSSTMFCAKASLTNCLKRSLLMSIIFLLVATTAVIRGL